MQQVFVVTLCVYPSVTVLVSSQGRGNGHPWNDIYFVPVTNYLIFNSGDYLGRVLAGMLEWVNQRPNISIYRHLIRIIHNDYPFYYQYSQAINRTSLLSCQYSEWHLFPLYCCAIRFQDIDFLLLSHPTISLYC